MASDDFEKCFGDFIDRREYDEAQNALFSVVRSSFKAGWESAGGKPPPVQPAIRFAPQKLKK
ncbi:MAG: hypothetical protein ACRCWR_06695 [Saezia sp.]